jgi:hypothetical protein
MCRRVSKAPKASWNRLPAIATGVFTWRIKGSIRTKWVLPKVIINELRAGWIPLNPDGYGRKHVGENKGGGYLLDGKVRAAVLGPFRPQIYRAYMIRPRWMNS